MTTLPSLKRSSTPSSPLSTMHVSVFDSRTTPGCTCASSAVCSAVRWVRIGGRAPRVGFFSRRCSSSPDRPFLIL